MICNTIFDRLWEDWLFKYILKIKICDLFNFITVSSLVRKFRQQSREQMEERRPNLVRALNKINDFYMELKWDFQSWGKCKFSSNKNILTKCFSLVPLVSRILPSDICKIYKSGANIRLDTTLVDFSDMRWERGDISFIFNGDAKANESLTVLDNSLKVYQKVRYEVSFHTGLLLLFFV